MGLPKKQRKKYVGPKHPWQAKRMAEEAILLKKYGLVNKKEIWRTQSLLRNWRARARSIVALAGEKRKEEEAKLISKLQKYGVLSEKASLDDVLALNITALLEKRLQSIVFKVGLAKSIKHARQLVTHRKIAINGIVISSPSALVKVGDKVGVVGGEEKTVKELKEIVAETPEANPEEEKKAEETFELAEGAEDISKALEEVGEADIKTVEEGK